MKPAHFRILLGAWLITGLAAFIAGITLPMMTQDGTLDGGVACRDAGRERRGGKSYGLTGPAGGMRRASAPAFPVQSAWRKAAMTRRVAGEAPRLA